MIKEQRDSDGKIIDNKHNRLIFINKLNGHLGTYKSRLRVVDNLSSEDKLNNLSMIVQLNIKTMDLEKVIEENILEIDNKFNEVKDSFDETTKIV